MTKTYNATDLAAFKSDCKDKPIYITFKSCQRQLSVRVLPDDFERMIRQDGIRKFNVHFFEFTVSAFDFK